MRTDTMVLIGMAAFAGLATLFALWAVFGERRKKRSIARCPKCWHDMSGLPSTHALTCPECGRNAKRTKRLHKKRRRWRRAALALLLGALPLWLYPAYERRDEGWSALVPTTGLIIASKWVPALDNHWVQPPSRNLLYERSMGMPRWQAWLYSAWRVPLDRATAMRQVIVPHTWFRGESIPVVVRGEPYIAPGHITLTVEVFDTDGAIVAENFYPKAWQSGMPNYRMPKDRGKLPAQDGDSHTVTLRIGLGSQWHWYHYTQNTSMNVEREREHTVQYQITLVDREDRAAWDRIATPVHGPEIDRIVSECIAMKFHSGRLHAYGVYDDEHDLDDVGFLMDFELVHDGQVIWRETEGHTFFIERGVPWHHDEHEVFSQSRLISRGGDLDPDEIIVRITSRPDLAMYDMESSRYWDGEVTMTLSEALSPQRWAR